MKRAPFRAGNALPHYLKGLLAETHALTGHPFALHPTVEGTIIPHLVLATREDPTHRLEYHPALAAHHVHLTLAGLLLVQRQWTPKHATQIQADSRRRQLPQEDQRQLSAELLSLGPQQSRHAESVMCARIVDLITGGIPGIQAEREIHARFKAHRPLQRAYLEALRDILCIHDALPLSAPVKTALQARVRDWTAVYLHVLLTSCAMESPSAVREIVARPRCRQLGAVADSKFSPTGSEDRKATDHIATLLALRSWYTWRAR